MAVFHGGPEARYNPQKIWEEIGGFRENLERGGEDTLFYYKVLKKVYRIVKVKESIKNFFTMPKEMFRLRRTIFK